LSLAGVALPATETPASGPDRSAYRFADAAFGGRLQGETILAGKAPLDSVALLGGLGRDDGDFQDAAGAPSWDGWTHIDITQRHEEFWHVDDYHCANLDPGTVPNHAWWCGTEFADDCGTGDFAGYGNSWDEQLDWWGAVGDSTQGVTVTVEAVFNYDNEPGYDYLFLEYEAATGMQQQAVLNGLAEAVVLNETFALSPADFVPHPGTGEPAVHLRWHFTSDGGWSDEDCLWTTQGAAQIDLIGVYFDQGSGPVLQGHLEDCNDNPVQWTVTFPPGVGDFAQVWTGLNDLDPCRTNNTPQVAFIDDGVVVPGTGGYQCWTWCYGPGGFIVNPRGGLQGPEGRLHNEIWSPPLAWPAGGYDGAVLAFDVYRHENLSPDSPGMFYTWHVRSTDDPAGQEGWTSWQDLNFVYYGGPDYLRHTEDLTGLLLPGPTYVQVALGCQHVCWWWCWDDGTPAPYFDNVSVKAIRHNGPVVSAWDIHQAQDGFPAGGVLDYADLGANRVRFDMAENIAPLAFLYLDPGDSVVVDALAVRTGATLIGPPELHWRLRPNPLFDPYRTAVAPNPVLGDSVREASGEAVAGRWFFDLPDSGFFFPGDILHYFVRAEDDAGGDIGLTLLPGDTTGFGLFPGDEDHVPMQYPHPFAVRALPSLTAPEPGAQPDILFWDDSGPGPGHEEWRLALANLGYRAGVDWDLFVTNGPHLDVHNGLGGQATATQIAGYSTLLYTAGDQTAATLCDGEEVDFGRDLDLLESWLLQGDKNLLAAGNHLAYDLGQGAAADFRQQWLSVTLVDDDLRPLIDNQATPLVLPIAGNPVGLDVEFIAFGGCPGLNYFSGRGKMDAIEAIGAGVRILEFADPAGQPGAYPYAAGVYHEVVEHGAEVITLPFGLFNVYTPAGSPGDSLAVRTRLLEQLLGFFGLSGTGAATAVPALDGFQVRSYPNPFNPCVKIEYRLPRPGELSLRIYNLRGELVRTLIEGMVPAGPGSVRWDGTDQRGRAAAAGVYFCEARALSYREIHKLALIR